MAFDCASLWLWSSVVVLIWFWLSVVDFTLALAFNCGFCLALGLWLSVVCITMALAIGLGLCATMSLCDCVNFVDS